MWLGSIYHVEFHLDLRILRIKKNSYLDSMKKLISCSSYFVSVQARHSSRDENKNKSRHGVSGSNSSSDASSRRNSNKAKPSDWRFGPAQLWYDMIDVPHKAEQCDYGFKLTQVIVSSLNFVY